MPIDYLSRRVALNNAARNLIVNRNPQDELSRTMTGIEGMRSRFLGNAGSQISSITGGPSPVMARIPEIDRKTQAILAKKKLELSRQRSNALFNHAFDMAMQAGQDVKTATAYARKIAEQKSQIDFATSEAEKGRQHSREMNALSNEYSQKGAALENEFQPDADYRSALIRVLLGTGAAVGTGYLLNKKYGVPTTATPTATPPPVNYNEDLYNPRPFGDRG